MSLWCARNFWDCPHGPLLSRIRLAAICSKTGSGHLGSVISVPVPYRSQELPLISLRDVCPNSNEQDLFNLPSCKVIISELHMN